MTLITDRWRFEIRPPRPLRPGKLGLAPVSPAVVARRLESPAYSVFRQVLEKHLQHGREHDLRDSSLPEGVRAKVFKALALRYWALGDAGDLRRARRALAAVNTGRWGAWCGAPDGIIDYLVGVDLLRAAGAMSPRALADFRGRLAPKVVDGFAMAPSLPQNNWRIETDSAIAMAALYWWHGGGRLPVDEWLAGALDGLSRVLFGLISADGAFEEGPNYSRRSAIPFVRLAWLYLHLSGFDLINHPQLSNWHRWQVEVKQPSGRTMPYDDSHAGVEAYPHALLVDRRYHGAGLQRWAHDRLPVAKGEYAAEAFLFFDQNIRPRRPEWAASRVLEASGTAVFRSGWGRDAIMGLLLARPLVPFGTDQVNTAHRHDDPLQILIAAHGELLAIDPGYGPGYGSDKRYTWYLTPAAHNIILVDGKGPPRITAYGGDCRQGNVSQSQGRVEELLRTPEIYGARATTSYRGVDFQRHVFFVRNRYFVMIDQVRSPRTHEYGWLLHGAGAQTGLGDGAVWTVGKARLTGRILAPSGLGVKFERGYHEHDQTHGYIRGIASGRDLTFAAVLAPDRADMAEPEIELLCSAPVMVRVRCEGMNKADLFSWNAGKPRRVRLGKMGMVAVPEGVSVRKLEEEEKQSAQ